MSLIRTRGRAVCPPAKLDALELPGRIEDVKRRPYHGRMPGDTPQEGFEFANIRPFAMLPAAPSLVTCRWYSCGIVETQQRPRQGFSTELVTLDLLGPTPYMHRSAPQPAVLETAGPR